MSEEQNIDTTQAEKPMTGEGVQKSAENPAEAAVKPRRRGRKPKSETEGVAASGASEQAKPARRTRKAAAKSADRDDATKDGAAPVESDEVRQARALAQISQASVVRRQRRAAERAAEMLASGAADVSASAADKSHAVLKGEKSEGEKSAPGTVAPVIVNGQAVIPFVDPSLRPHRRGRKPKAYVEAEKAAAAALAAAQAAAQAATGTETPSVAAPQEASEPVRDTRPGRGSRSQKEKAGETSSVAPAVQESGNENAEASHQGGQPRRSHQNRRGEGGANGAQGQGQNHGDRGFGDRRGSRQQNNNQRNKRNAGRFAPAEPSLTRDELTEMKVAELRQKAKELEIDITGKKKAELVEEVYAAAARAEGFREIEGILDITNEGFGYIRAHGYMPSRDDAFVAAQMIRAAGLRPGDYLAGTLRPARVNDKFPGLAKLRSVNGMDPEDVRRRPKFADLTPIYPNEPLKMEHGKESITGRAIDIVSPIGKGQRGLIVSPPKAGKTTILKKICQSISANNPEVHLICLLVDERPEEVTDMQRSIKGDVVASTFDMPADNHTRVSELVIERAKRIVELGGDVVVVLDSITRLARAYNLAAPASGRILSGGVDSAALYPPKRFLGAARNIENGGSLTILASALIDTGSKMDEVIFEEFKGTGNMELKLDRDLADRRIFPAIDPVASGTRNEDLLIDETMKPFVWGIRRILANMNNAERAAASFIKGLKSTNSNQEFLIRTAKKAADHEASL